jgi:hypothetical protein
VMKETAYAILSHQWLPAGELTFQDMSKIGQSVDGFHQLLALREETPDSKRELLNADNLLDSRRDASGIARRSTCTPMLLL